VVGGVQLYRGSDMELARLYTVRTALARVKGHVANLFDKGVGGRVVAAVARSRLFVSTVQNVLDTQVAVWWS
jgi:hypothetical protein